MIIAKYQWLQLKILVSTQSVRRWTVQENSHGGMTKLNFPNFYFSFQQPFIQQRFSLNFRHCLKSKHLIYFPFISQKFQFSFNFLNIHLLYHDKHAKLLISFPLVMKLSSFSLANFSSMWDDDIWLYYFLNLYIRLKDRKQPKAYLWLSKIECQDFLYLYPNLFLLLIIWQKQTFIWYPKSRILTETISTSNFQQKTIN